MLFSDRAIRQFPDKFLFIGQLLAKVFNISRDLKQSKLFYDEEKYLAASFYSALIFFFLFFIMLNSLFFIKAGKFEIKNFVISLSFSLAIGFFLFFLYIYYPSMLASKIALQLDESLIYALRSIQIQIASGISLYDAMQSVALSNYGEASKEFKRVVDQIRGGQSEEKVTRELAIYAKSDYLKRVAWQLHMALKSGASLEHTLENLVSSLTEEEISKIKKFAGELNIWLLVYLLFAGAIPSLGIVFLILILFHAS
jgi:flagellar protein FlaJ